MKKISFSILCSIAFFACSGENGADGLNGIDGKDGVDGAKGDKGDNGKDCEVTKVGDELTFTCGDSTVSIDLNDYLKNSSSSVVSESSSSTTVVKPNWVYLNPDVKYGEMTDSRDGQVYKTVKIGNQVWMAENLNYELANSYCYDNVADNCIMRGRYYEWKDALTVCPKGWHLPSKEEFETLLAISKGKLRSNSWIDGDDVFGFSLLLYDNGAHCVGKYCYSTFDSADLWSSSENGRYVWFFEVAESEAEMNGLGGDPGPNVRCLQDSN